LGPLGGPVCTRQTGYHNVLYWDSWNAAQPLVSPCSPRRLRRASGPARSGCQGRRV